MHEKLTTSSFIFVGITSAFAEWTDAHRQLVEGMTGYGRYYWRGFVDKADRNYRVIFALPSIFIRMNVTMRWAQAVAFDEVDQQVPQLTGELFALEIFGEGIVLTRAIHRSPCDGMRKSHSI